MPPAKKPNKIDKPSFFILLVDDSKTALKTHDDLLRELGFTNIHRAFNGKEALEMMQRQKYDLIFSDWNMAPMDGLELLKAVRANEETKAIPLILVTSEAKPEKVLAAKQAGVSNYMLKPYKPSTLKEKLLSVLGVLEI